LSGSPKWVRSAYPLKSHLEVEEEASTICRALQVLCEKSRMLRTYVRMRRSVLRDYYELRLSYRGRRMATGAHLRLLAASQPLELLARSRIEAVADPASCAGLLALGMPHRLELGEERAGRLLAYFLT